MTISHLLRAAVLFALCALLSGCAAIQQSLQDRARSGCPVTEPVLLLPPDDPAVNGAPAEGYYYTNENGSILAAGWWWEGRESGEGTNQLTADENGIKTGWFRPPGEDLVITGSRIDGEAPPLGSSVPCCYPTRFQATGLMFPTEGCWEVTARAQGESLTFIVWVDP